MSNSFITTFNLAYEEQNGIFEVPESSYAEFDLSVLINPVIDNEPIITIMVKAKKISDESDAGALTVLENGIDYDVEDEALIIAVSGQAKVNAFLQTIADLEVGTHRIFLEVSSQLASTSPISFLDKNADVTPERINVPLKQLQNRASLGGATLVQTSPGSSLPDGGTTGQVLKKASNTDQDVEWGDDETGEDATQVQADWDETDPTEPEFIQNKPNIPTGVDTIKNYFTELSTMTKAEFRGLNPAGFLRVGYDGTAQDIFSGAGRVFQGTPDRFSTVGVSNTNLNDSKLDDFNALFVTGQGVNTQRERIIKQIAYLVCLKFSGHERAVWGDLHDYQASSGDEAPAYVKVERLSSEVSTLTGSCGDFVSQSWVIRTNQGEAIYRITEAIIWHPELGAVHLEFNSSVDTKYDNITATSAVLASTLMAATLKEIVTAHTPIDSFRGDVRDILPAFFSLLTHLRTDENLNNYYSSMPTVLAGFLVYGFTGTGGPTGLTGKRFLCLSLSKTGVQDSFNGCIVQILYNFDTGECWRREKSSSDTTIPSGIDTDWIRIAAPLQTEPSLEEANATDSLTFVVRDDSLDVVGYFETAAVQESNAGTTAARIFANVRANDVVSTLEQYDNAAPNTGHFVRPAGQPAGFYTNRLILLITDAVVGQRTPSALWIQVGNGRLKKLSLALGGTLGIAPFAENPSKYYYTDVQDNIPAGTRVRLNVEFSDKSRLHKGNPSASAKKGLSVENAKQVLEIGQQLTDSEIGDKAFSNPPDDLSDTEKTAARDAIGAGTGGGDVSMDPTFVLAHRAYKKVITTGDHPTTAFVICTAGFTGDIDIRNGQTIPNAEIPDYAKSLVLAVQETPLQGYLVVLKADDDADGTNDIYFMNLNFLDSAVNAANPHQAGGRFITISDVIVNNIRKFQTNGVGASYSEWVYSNGNLNLSKIYELYNNLIAEGDNPVLDVQNSFLINYTRSSAPTSAHLKISQSITGGQYNLSKQSVYSLVKQILKATGIRRMVFDDSAMTATITKLSFNNQYFAVKSGSSFVAADFTGANGFSFSNGMGQEPTYQDMRVGFARRVSDGEPNYWDPFNQFMNNQFNSLTKQSGTIMINNVEYNVYFSNLSSTRGAATPFVFGRFFEIY